MYKLKHKLSDMTICLWMCDYHIPHYPLIIKHFHIHYMGQLDCDSYNSKYMTPFQSLMIDPLNVFFIFSIKRVIRSFLFPQNLFGIGDTVFRKQRMRDDCTKRIEFGRWIRKQSIQTLKARCHLFVNPQTNSYRWDDQMSLTTQSHRSSIDVHNLSLSLINNNRVYV